jgi:hypothetical protein
LRSSKLSKKLLSTAILILIYQHNVVYHILGIHT